MGVEISKEWMQRWFESWQEEYDIYAPAVFRGGGRFSDTDCVRYKQVRSIDEIEFQRKSEYSFKEILLPVSETLFYFTGENTTVPDGAKKGAVIFLRSCDIHALRRLDQMYLKNGAADFYYSRLREKVVLVLIGCHSSFDGCFCVSMGSSRTGDYDLYIEPSGDGAYRLDIKNKEWISRLDLFTSSAGSGRTKWGKSSPDILEQAVSPAFVTENRQKVCVPDIPENIESKVRTSPMWDSYDSRCIACGRCNFVCPTCTCFTMQDIFYSDNGKAGERRRVWASCMVDGYTDVAGGGSYRRKHGQRMRFKVLHKVLDYKKRAGESMCVGCGRCDDICPEYISFANSINRLHQMTAALCEEESGQNMTCKGEDCQDGEKRKGGVGNE